MNKILSILLIIISPFFLDAQTGNGIGIKGGINFGSTGNLNNTFFNGFNNTSFSQGTNLEFGYHIGVFGKLSLNDNFYFRPELIFTKRQNEYNITSPEEESLNIYNLDIPLLLGVKVIGPLSFFIGPSLHYILDRNIDSPASFNIDIENNFTFGVNTGVAFNFHKFGIDIRYERSFEENLLSLQSNINTSFFATIDTRAEQIILSLSYKIF